jgi:hypothetical protein
MRQPRTVLVGVLALFLLAAWVFPADAQLD